MAQHRVQKHVVAFAAALVVVACAIGFYVTQLNSAVSDASLAGMDDVAAHDVESVEASLDVSFERLDAVGSRLRAGSFDNLSEVQSRLLVEADSMPTFDAVYLIDADGLVYSSDLAGVDPGRDVLADFFSDGAEHFVMRVNESADAAGAGASSDMLAYAVRLRGVEAAGVRFVALVGTGSMDSVRDQLALESFDGRGVTSIVNNEGYFIVNGNRILGRESFGNYYDELADAALGDGMTLDSVRAGVTEHDRFTITYATAEGERMVASLLPVEGTRWSLVMTVPRAVFDERTGAIVAMTMAMLAVVACALVAMMLMLFRSAKRTVQANAHAQARTDFLSNMSHEIRTPLNGIVGLNHLMGEHLDDRAAIEGYVRKMGEVAQYLLALVNDILDMSKLQAGKVDLAHDPFDVERMVDGVCTMQREGIEARGIAFERRCSLWAPVAVGDEMRVKQILMNIMSNAAKFTPAGGRIALEVSQDDVADDEDRVTTRFSVRDTGCGMSPEFVERIFDPFTQEHEGAAHAGESAGDAGEGASGGGATGAARTSGAQAKGTGLGMSISHLLATCMGGRIEVESELGRGSCFTVVLPLEIAESPDEMCVLYASSAQCRADAEAAAARVGEETRDAAQPTADRPPSVLVAEDNELNAEILVSILSGAGFTCALATDGKRAVEAFAASEPGSIDAILMDAHMPVMDGFEAARAIRALDRPDAQTVRIFACTASTFTEDVERARASGMDDFLPKPIDFNLMLEKLRNL
ncbi:MAG: ATP-binding protein [Eggerthellaceae bacterium]|nr:ATP-binding protein [Eggerthellaceae bacterium]